MFQYRAIPSRLLQALVHHALGGLRHFVWDTGAGLGPERMVLARLTLIGSLVITLGLWILGYWVR